VVDGDSEVRSESYRKFSVARTGEIIITRHAACPVRKPNECFVYTSKLMMDFPMAKLRPNTNYFHRNDEHFIAQLVVM
jgi:2,4-dienoyl-CoA reductase-like NADH-dependent reductase (Old Yellow Enzyme family)